MRRFFLLGLAVSALFGQAVLAQPSLQSGSVAEAAGRLNAGEFLWAPEIAPQGPILFVISIANQRAVLYRNGIPIGITTVSTGRQGHRTPTGIFTVLQRAAVHYSSIYNSAPMPHMQRLTSYGIALHGGDLPGYPASHGCIRLPREFARLLFGVTRLGMTVVITNEAALPRVAPAESLLRGGDDRLLSDPSQFWRPERARSGPVSVVISVADRRAVVLRNGVVIGQAPVQFDRPIAGTSAYVMQATDRGRNAWLRVALPARLNAATAPEPGSIRVAERFRTAVEQILTPGATVVITTDSLRGGGAARATTELESEAR
jgi:hypothetical protein